jgi:hypothetical protein
MDGTRPSWKSGNREYRNPISLLSWQAVQQWRAHLPGTETVAQVLKSGKRDVEEWQVSETQRSSGKGLPEIVVVVQ